MQPCHCLLSLLHALALHISLDPTHALLMCLLSVNQTGVYCEPDWCVQWTRLVCTRGFALLKICTYIWIICECAVGHIFCPHIGVGMYIMWCIIVCFVILNLMCKCVMISVRNVISVLCNWFLLLWMDWGVFISVNTEMTMACPMIGDFSLHLWIDTLGTWKSNRYWRMYVWLSIEKTF